MEAAMPTLRTSSGSPIRVDFVASKLLSVTGKLGLTIAPGKKDPLGGWNRDLDTDLARLAAHYRTRVLVSLMEPYEYTLLGISDLAKRAKPLGIKVVHFPIHDVRAPSRDRMKEFAALIKGLCRSLDRGDTVVVHCRGGLGRSGTVAACVLVAAGHSPEEAIALTKRARPGAIEVSAQEDWIGLYARHVAPERPKRADRRRWRPPPLRRATRARDLRDNDVCQWSTSTHRPGGTDPRKRTRRSTAFSDAYSAGRSATRSDTPSSSKDLGPPSSRSTGPMPQPHSPMPAVRRAVSRTTPR